MNKHIERPTASVLDNLRDQGATKREIADIINAPTGEDAWDRVFELGGVVSHRRPKTRNVRTVM